MTTHRHLCIHGHFYQPPRENPWLEAIEQQDSAYPFHDWNERIATECYAPNAFSRILDESGAIIRIDNNYSRMSFNVGPTLMAWLETNDPDTYHAILAADVESRLRFNGQGGAIAQPYNHMIMPLATRRDKVTQVLWGLRDFEIRFGRVPQGMWLPETAADTETLEVLAEHGMRFTILAPHQARRYRRRGDSAWLKTDGAIDTRRPYRVALPSGADITVFFYDGPVSRAVAFEGLLKSGEQLAARLMKEYSGDADSELVHIATDGETFGHHHRFGDMALAYALHHIESRALATVTNYAAYLNAHPPDHEAEIHENTSWSCSHGLERWRSDCGCHTGAHPEWTQRWRGPLRDALDWLRDELAHRYEQAAGELFHDPWAARNDYIKVILDRSSERLHNFLDTHARDALSDEDTIHARKWCEVQRHAMLMYTSCGWFFDDLSGIETIQVLRYAARAIQLAESVSGDSLEEKFLDILDAARSNVPGEGTGRSVYQRNAKATTIDLTWVAAHFVVNSLFSPPSAANAVYCYTVELDDYHTEDAGRAKLAVGRGRVSSTITGEWAHLSFAALHLGDHNLTAGVRGYAGEDAYHRMRDECLQSFRDADFPKVIRELDKHFGPDTYSLKSLFHDEQRKALAHILDASLADTEADLRAQYEQYIPLIRYVADLKHPLPRPILMTAEFILDRELHTALSRDRLDLDRAREVLAEARQAHITLDTEGLGLIFSRTLTDLAACWERAPEDTQCMDALNAALELAPTLPFHVDVWRVQNVIYTIGEHTYPLMRTRRDAGDDAAAAWLDEYARMAKALRVRLPVPSAPG